MCHELQINATCNVEGGPFNDWFTGHLNYQIEHHLFPTMPRHNYAIVAPLVAAVSGEGGVQQEAARECLLAAFARCQASSACRVHICTASRRLSRGQASHLLSSPGGAPATFCSRRR